MRTHQLKLQRPLAIFDLEATGVNVITDRVVEIAIFKAMPDGTVEEWHSLVNPQVSIPDESTAIHGLSDEDVKFEPPFKQLANQIIRFLDNADLGGFNVLKFDIPMLVEEFLRAEVDFQWEKRKIIDAAKIFHTMEKRTLSAAYQFYCGKDISELGEGAHNAKTDTQATLEVINAQVLRYEGKEVTDHMEHVLGTMENDVNKLHDLFNANMVDLAGRMVFNERGEIEFNFGKHKGKLVEDVLRREPQYYNWIVSNEFPLDTKNWLTKIKLSMIRV